VSTSGTAPVIDRPIELRFQGDWGQANLHRICGWLSQELGDRTGPGSRFAVWSGRGGADALTAVVDGQVDIAIMTPTAAAAMIASRNGPLAPPGSERLRALATLPQRDRLVTCVDAALGIDRHEQLRDRLADLTIATSPDDGTNLIGLAAHRLLAAVGVEPADVERAGGRFLHSERPFPAIAAFADGSANVLIHEAIMTPAWQRVADQRSVTYLDVDPVIGQAFGAWHWPTATVEAGFLPQLDRDLRALEFSDFLVLCRDDLPDDVAALTTWCMVATRSALEAQYSHLPPERSPVTYPLRPAAMAQTPLPLHAAAEATHAQLDDDTTAGDALMWA
jgi:TRAP-type uncharacterized transport system substrate-binding protein